MNELLEAQKENRVGFAIDGIFVLFDENSFF